MREPATLFSSTKNLLLLAVIGLLFFGFFPTETNAWWNASWLNRKKVTFNNASSSENLTDFPALVNLNSARIDYSKTQNSGQDIRFVDTNDTTELKYQIDLWDEAATSSVWVKVPQIDAASTTDYVWMYYNNTGASDNSTTTGVWDSNFKVVTHFGATDIVTDSTSNANNPTLSGTTVTTTSAVVGYAREFDGANDNLNFGTSTSISDLGSTGGKTLTISLWITFDTFSTTQAYFSKDKVGLGQVGANSGTGAMIYRHQWSGAANLGWTTSNTFLTGTRYYLAITYDANTTSSDALIYMNGTNEATTESNGPPSGSPSSDSAYALRVGENASGTSDFDGRVDEFRYSSVVRSSSWIVADYKNGIDQYNTFGNQESVNPPVISSIATSSVTSSSITITWTTDEDADSRVVYGTSTGVYPGFFSSSTLLASHNVGLTSLASSTTYYYRVASADSEGNNSTSSESTFTTSAGPDTTAPADVTNLSVVSSSASSVRLTWTSPGDDGSTGTATTYDVRYATSTITSGNFGSATAASGEPSPSVAGSTEIFTVTGLGTSTLYYFALKTSDEVPNTSGISNVVSTTTATSSDVTAPSISAITASAGTNGATITWTTDEAADSQVEYGETAGYGSETTLNSSLVTSHSVAISGLNPSTTYHYRVKSRDEAGNLATSGDNTFSTLATGVIEADTKPPVISQISVETTTSTAKITWKTNEDATSQVEYGKSTTYDKTTTLKELRLENYKAEHEKLLVGLEPNTKYNFRVISIDSVGNKALSGNFTFTTDKPPPPPAPPKPPASKISNLKVASIRPTLAKITWETDIPSTALVSFGTKRGEYSLSTIEFATLKKEHSVTLSDLLPETEYFYLAVSRNSAGVEATSTEGSFKTESLEIQSVVELAKPAALRPGSPETQIPKRVAGETVTVIPILPTEGDKTPPEVTLFRFAENPTENRSPLIRGRAIDRQGVIAGISYSVDKGTSWHPVETVTGIGSSVATFSARPANLRDGNYSVLFRARDNSGNTGRSEASVLVVDVLPPSTGANIFLLGSQSILPSSSGVLSSLTGITQRITISAGGGAVSVEIVARKKVENKELGIKNKAGIPANEKELVDAWSFLAPPAQAQTKISEESAATSTARATSTGEFVFPLTYSKPADLWFGDITLTEAGLYELEARATDGTGQISSRKINSVLVTPPGTVKEFSGTPVSRAKVSVYQYLSEFDEFLLWPGEIFDQSNPQLTDEDGGYRFILPPGRYYLKVEKEGYRTLWTNILEFSDHKITNFALRLKPRFGIPLPSPVFGVSKLFLPSFPDFASVRLEDRALEGALSESPSGLIGKPAPLFVLPTTSGEPLDIRYLRGKKTVLSLWATWAPLAQSQVPILDQLQRELAEDVNVLLVSFQESLGTADTYLRRGGYKLTAAVDREAGLASIYPVLTMPEHIFIDRKGVIRDIYVGFLSGEQFRKILERL